MHHFFFSKFFEGPLGSSVLWCAGVARGPCGCVWLCVAVSVIPAEPNSGESSRAGNKGVNLVKTKNSKEEDNPLTTVMQYCSGCFYSPHVPVDSACRGSCSAFAAAAAAAAAFLSPASRYNHGKNHSRRLPRLTRPLFACLCRRQLTEQSGATAAAAQQAMFKSNYPGCPSQDLLQVRVVVGMRRVIWMTSS